MNRIWVITVGCVLWGVMTAAFCFMTSLNLLSMLLWAITGIGLALVVPNVQSVTAGAPQHVLCTCIDSRSLLLITVLSRAFCAKGIVPEDQSLGCAAQSMRMS